MNRDSRRPGAIEHWALAAVCGLILLAVLAMWGAGELAQAWGRQPADANPFQYVVDLATGRRRWSGLATGILVVLGSAAAGGLTLSGAWARRRRKRPRNLASVDRSARMMARPADLIALSPKGVAASAARLRPGSTVDPRNPTEHGRLVGRTIVGDMPVRTSWESNGTHIWGPRTGKTMCLTIPMVCEAPGPVVATSNKRDLPDGTRAVRRVRGREFVFDPQAVAGAEPTFWYDPITRVETIRDAEVLTAAFTAAEREPGDRKDAYFDNAAESLLSAYFLAAHRGGRPITDVYQWVANSRDRTPLNLLRGGVDDLVAHDIESIQQAPDKQREGVYDTAKTLLKCLRDPDVLTWVTAPRRAKLPEFSPSEFVRGTDTLWALSMEGPGSAAPLVAALTEHVCTAAVRVASTMPLGRLDPPLECCLDEAGNVCRWRDLPNLYSHFGSRGVVIDTILQSWSQGVETWGQLGMQKLWSASNVRTYGGGEANPEFLEALSRLVGPFDREIWSASVDHQGHRSHSASSRPDPILPVDLLGSMPVGRALVLASGSPAAIVRTVPWTDRQFAAEVEASFAEFDPRPSAHGPESSS